MIRRLSGALIGAALVVGCASTHAETASIDADYTLTGPKVGEVFAKPDKIYIRIGREFPAFDTDYSGELALFEFRKWLIPLTDLRVRYDDATVSEEYIAEFIEEGFDDADEDENGEISMKELAVYFGQDL